MKTFKDLKKGDKLIVKNNPVYKDCDVTINGHNYVTERVFEDTVVTICSKPLITTTRGIGFGGIPAIQLRVIENPDKIPYNIIIKDYISRRDLTETEKYKIVQDNDN